MTTELHLRPDYKMLEESKCCIFPKASELSEILNNLECPEKNCNDIFHNPSNLTLHLQKRHGRTVESACRPKYGQFYCPEKSCKYYFNPEVSNVNKNFSNRFFTQFRYLKQHYIKVHMVKPFICLKCNKGFPTELHKTRHDEECGSKYTCSCGVVYNSISALKTHAMRKGHAINTTHSIKTKYMCQSTKSSETLTVIANNDSDKQTIDVTTLTKSLPKGASVLILHGLVNVNDLTNTNLFHLVKLNSQTVETSSQTESARPTSLKRKKSASPVKSTEKSVKKRMSQQTQTGEKNPKISSQTQTMNQFLKESKIKNSAKKRKKSMKTQTIVKPENVVSTVNQKCETFTVTSGKLDLLYNDVTNHDEDKTVKLEANKKAIDQLREKPVTETSNNHVEAKMEDRKIEERPLLDEESSESDNFKKHDICLPQLWLSNESSKEIDCKDISSLLERKTDDRSLCLYQDSNSSDRNYTSLCHIETQTDNRLNNLLDDYLTNCETQTNDILDQDTRWTQTCDDTFLPDLVDFTNNETQTAWSFLNNSPLSSSINLVHSETQTPPHVQEFNIGQL
ncbi:zinc finger protein SHOOT GRAVITROPISM 5 isoform X2 [Nilaparvata lugens]|uniref:zinc finger protein SHOOT GRAVITROPISM 5 isoform X2 n=1 Tax=Nilaparvata lugens TaxID=108931 RepID=UPI00193D9DE6|nr:zinc finger protein SHOOT GRAVITROPISM 5 isoform X2 [Nilaparvata lugens]